MTKKEIIKQVFNDLSLLRNREIFVSEQNKAKVMKNEQYANLEAKKRLLNMQIGKLQFEKSDTLKEQSELAKVIAEQDELLKNIGIEKSDLMPKFTCKKCNDTGICNNETCVCAQQMFMTKLMQNCNVTFT